MNRRLPASSAAIAHLTPELPPPSGRDQPGPQSVVSLALARRRVEREAARKEVDEKQRTRPPPSPAAASRRPEHELLARSKGPDSVVSLVAASPLTLTSFHFQILLLHTFLRH